MKSHQEASLDIRLIFSADLKANATSLMMMMKGITFVPQNLNRIQ